MRHAFAALLGALMASGAVQAQIAVSAADGKQVRPGQDASTRTADAVSIIDARRYPPRTIATLPIPASMIGTPGAVAVARDGSFALVSAAQKLEGGQLVPSGTVTVLDLSQPDSPKVIQTVMAGPGASGVSINRAGTLALVASTGDDSVSIFTISGKRLSPAGKVQLEQKARPTDVVIAPSGRSGMVVAQGASRLVPITISGSTVTVSGTPIVTGMQPYGAIYSPDGRFIYNTNLGGRPVPAGTAPVPGRPRIGTVSATEIATGRTESVDVGITPEYVALSPDGRLAAAVVANGTGAAPGKPDDHGLLQLYSVAGTKLTKLDEVHTAGWCQGMVFSDDAKTILLQCAATKEIEVYRIAGGRMARDTNATLRFDARPGSIATARSR